MKRFDEYEVPRGDWFVLDDNVGTEHIFVFLSREPMKTLPGFERPVKSFQPGSPALDRRIAVEHSIARPRVPERRGELEDRRRPTW